MPRILYTCFNDVMILSSWDVAERSFRDRVCSGIRPEEFTAALDVMMCREAGDLKCACNRVRWGNI
jgi:hypothetical protein